MPTIRILLDNNVARHMLGLLRPHQASHAADLGWAAISNGELIRAAHAAGFEVMVTCDQNIEHQQNLSGHQLAFIVLTTTHWPTIRSNIDDVLASIEAAKPGKCLTINLPRPPRRRRPHNRSVEP